MKHSTAREGLNPNRVVLEGDLPIESVSVLYTRLFLADVQQKPPDGPFQSRTPAKAFFSMPVLSGPHNLFNNRGIFYRFPCGAEAPSPNRPRTTK